MDTTGGAQTAATDGDAATVDAGPDGPGAEQYLLSCELQRPSPFVIDDLQRVVPTNTSDPTRRFDRVVRVARATANKVRVAAYRRGTSEQKLYTLDPDSNGVVSTNVPSQGNAEMVRLANAVGMVGRVPTSGASPGFGLTLVPDTFVGTGAVPASVALVPPGTMSNERSGVSVYRSTEFFYGAYWLNTTTRETIIGSNRAGGAPVTIGNSRTNVTIKASLGVNGSQYLFIENDGPPDQNGFATAQLYKSKELPAGSTPSSRPLTETGQAPVMTLGAAVPNVAVGASVDRVNLAFGQINQNSVTELFTYRVGTVPASQMDTFRATDLAKGPVVVDSNDLPIDGGDSGWFGDDFVAIGRGALATSPGFNFIWFDAEGHLRGRQTGSSRILTDRGVVDTGSVALAQKIAARLVTFDIVWVEHKQDTQGPYDVLYYNTIACH